MPLPAHTLAVPPPGWVYYATAYLRVRYLVLTLCWLINARLRDNTAV